MSERVARASDLPVARFSPNRRYRYQLTRRVGFGDRTVAFVMPSGRFAANAAWLAIQVMAHNLARWTARTGLGEQVVTTKTLRRRFFSLAGRITRSARRLTLHLPQRWPWETQFSRALARLRAIPLPT